MQQQQQQQHHLVLVGACYLDTILSVPHYPEEDSKLRATSVSIRRGGNCPNSLEVLQQLLRTGVGSSLGGDGSDDAATPAFSGLQAVGSTHLQMHLVSPLPARASAATAQILSSFGPPRSIPGDVGEIDFSRCLYREDHEAPASSYVLRSSSNGSRTLVNYNDLPEMTVDEFKMVIESLRQDLTTISGAKAGHERQQRQWWWHFEGRIPETTLDCMRAVRQEFDGCADKGGRPGDVLRISVEVEKPGRQGLRELAAEADVVFYSRTWAEHSGYASPEECLRGEKLPRASLAYCTWGADGAACLSVDEETCFRCPVEAGEINVVDSVGAGDTFIAGILYGLTRKADEWDRQMVLRFAVKLATCKVQQEGFQGLSNAL